MKLGIKAKILAATVLVVTVSLFLSGSFAYFYFLKIFKEKAVKDDMAKLNQISQQMEYQIDDIKKLGLSIIVNPEVQDYVRQQKYPDYYERLAWANNKLDYINKQIFLREYIHSAAILNNEGTVWYSTVNPKMDDYFQSKLNEAWFGKYRRNNEQYYFSDPFPISNVTHDGNSTVTVVSCIVQFRNIDDPYRVAGLLFLNIYLDYFDKYLKINSADYDGFLWLNKDNTVMYRQGPLPQAKLMEFIPLQKASGISYAEKFKGYGMVNQSLSNGWKLISFTSNKRLFQRIRFIFYFFLIFTFVSLALIIFVVLPIILRITRPITQLTKATNEVSSGNLNILLNISSRDELEDLANSFNKMTRDLQKYLAESVEHEKMKREMEFEILLSQVNPHFIYNVLNTIIYLARRDKSNDIASLADSLIRILQDGIKLGDQGLLTTVREEIEIVNHYIAIQQFRYPDRFELNWNIDEKCLRCLVPKTIIQPLVENALFHGICPQEAKGTIIVTINRMGQELIINIEDNGIGMTPEMIQTLLRGEKIYEPETKLRPVGLANIRDRIHFIYGENYGISIQSVPDRGTKVSINIPFRTQESL
jgi:two-component system sensor histidine kinase YesM